MSYAYISGAVPRFFLNYRLLLAMTRGFMVQYAPLNVYVHSFSAKKSERKHQFGGKMNE
jgi:hypothetical protein